MVPGAFRGFMTSSMFPLTFDPGSTSRWEPRLWDICTYLFCFSVCATLTNILQSCFCVRPVTFSAVLTILDSSSFLLHWRCSTELCSMTKHLQTGSCLSFQVYVGQQLIKNSHWLALSDVIRGQDVSYLSVIVHGYLNVFLPFYRLLIEIDSDWYKCYYLFLYFGFFCFGHIHFQMSCLTPVLQ